MESIWADSLKLNPALIIENRVAIPIFNGVGIFPMFSKMHVQYTNNYNTSKCSYKFAISITFIING